MARAVGALVTDGTLAPGDKLPPIRSVAAALGVSTSTVADAWSVMRDHGLIETDRRRGTTVRPSVGHGRRRWWRVPMPPGTLDLDLSTGTPDPRLLPALQPILAKIHSDLEVSSYLEPPMLAELGVELSNRWPYEPPALAIMDGANDGLDRIIRSIVKLGDVVVVEDPTYPLLLDLLELAGAEIVGVALDDDGPRLDQLAAALTRNPRAVVIQTGAHNPTGVTLSPERAVAIATLVSPTDSIVIEDEHAGATDAHPPVSLGTYLPQQVFRIHSFSKSYGPDLRIAALSGPEAGVAEIEQRRQLGPGWTSRLTQRILLEMLRSEDVDAQIAVAAEAYRQRRVDLVEALRAGGIELNHGAGLNVWVPVAHEHMATVALAAQGIGVAPGEPFRVHDSGQFIRVTAANIRSEVESVAARITAAARTPTGR